ncbi:MAG: Class SAM-dependent methyltransferase [Chitinophagaceae bacterium]|nr:Class SAM-dependent methyltransferase [Chitinophagaceae bacterium]
MKNNYNKIPEQIIKSKRRDIAVFSTEGTNIDHSVVEAFGDEWLKFQNYTDETIDIFVKEYFDILDDTMVNKNTYAIDIGCGTGRWTKYLSTRAGFIEAIDPSNAVFAADNLLGDITNVRLSKASVETIPFDDETFDFAMSVGVLHHIPNTQQAMTDCIKKVKKGGYFYCYLYYNLDNRGFAFKLLFKASDLIRKMVSSLPAKIKKVICDILAAVIYLPMVLLVRFFYFIGLKKIGAKMPLSPYKNKSFFVLRNDALDRFGTKLEQRFSREEVIEMMKNAGLDNIIVGHTAPFYRAVGRKN